MIRLKRIYEKPKQTDGVRVLVDRLWPRGVSKDQAQVDLWLRALAPSDTLRRWFAHDPTKWAAFCRKYHAELNQKRETLQVVRRLEAVRGIVTLLYAATDETHNNAVALLQQVQRHAAAGRPGANGA